MMFTSALIRRARYSAFCHYGAKEAEPAVDFEGQTELLLTAVFRRPGTNATELVMQYLDDSDPDFVTESWDELVVLRPWLNASVTSEVLRKIFMQIRHHVTRVSSEAKHASGAAKAEVNKSFCFVASKAACLLFRLLRMRGLHMEPGALEPAAMVCARLASSDVLDKDDNRISMWHIPSGWTTLSMAVLSSDVLSQLRFDLRDDATWCYRLLTNNLRESELSSDVKACVRSLWSSHADILRDEMGEGKQRQASAAVYRDLDAEQEFESEKQGENYELQHRTDKRVMLENFTVDSLFSFCIPPTASNPGACLRFLSSPLARKSSLIGGFLESRLRQEFNKRSAVDPSVYFPVALPAVKRKKQ